MYHHHHQSVLPKGRSLTASAGTKAAFLPKTHLPPQTQKPTLQFYQGWIGAAASRWFPHPTLSLASEQSSKDPKGHNLEVRRVDLGNWGLRTSPKFTTGVMSVQSGFLTRSEIRSPNHNNNNSNNDLFKAYFTFTKTPWWPPRFTPRVSSFTYNFLHIMLTVQII